MRLLRFTARTQRRTLLVGAALTVLLAVATGSAYQSSYPDDQARHAAAELSRQDAALTAMYGKLAEPGTATQLYSWEMGTYLTLIAAVLAILLTVSLTRTGEDRGSAEILRATGLSPAAPLRAAALLCGLTALALSILTTLAAALGTGGSEGADLVGALVLGADIGLTFALIAAVTAVVAQILPSANATREAAFALLGLSFLVRALADTQDLTWLNGLSPLGLRALSDPYAGNHILPLLLALAVAVVLTALAAVLHRRRDLGTGLLRARARGVHRLPVHGVLGLERRLRRNPTLIWAGAVTVGGAVFTAMGSSAVASTENGDVDGGFLGTPLAGGDPVAAYLAYTGTVVGIVAGVYAVLTVLALSDEEQSGRLAHVLAAGIGRTRPLAAAFVATAVGSLIILTLTALATALVATQVLDGYRVAGQAFTQIFGQWPALLAVGGCAGLAAAAGTRWRHLGWIPLGYSAFVALLGQLLNLPEPLVDLGFFRHVPELGSGATPWALGVLVLVAGACAVAGMLRFGSRDLATG